MNDPPPIPIFPRAGNRMVAVNPALVRSVETEAGGRVKIVFSRDHELLVDGSLFEVMKALWGGASMLREIKELPDPPQRSSADHT